MNEYEQYSKRKRKQKNKYNRLYDIDVYIVYGSPASGKTTYVKKHMEEGDMVVDLDLIKQSISMRAKSDVPDNLLNIAFRIRDYLYDIIEYREELECNNIWVIASLPLDIDREYLFNRLQATKIIYIEATKEECIERAMADEERTNKEIQVVI